MMTARNLALTAKTPHDLIAPGSGCYLALKKGPHYIAEYPGVTGQVQDALRRGGLDATGPVNVRYPLDVLVILH